MQARFLASDRTYGARGVWHNLLVDGVSCGQHRIERLTQQAALAAHLLRRKMLLDTGMRSTNAVAPNVLDWTFTAASANHKWVDDFIYLWTAEGWLYVTAVVDPFSRRVVGWSMHATMTTHWSPMHSCWPSGGGAARGRIAPLRSG